MSSTRSSVTGKIYPLTSIRFFLAFQVAVRHTVGTFLPQFDTAVPNGPLSGFLWQHVIASTFEVSFFFLLSGYILSLVYLTGAMGKGRFFSARFVRIYPLYVATLLWDTPHFLVQRVGRVGWTIALGKTTATFAAHLAMLQAWNPIRLMGIADPNWSLSAEAFFYLCFPFLGIRLWKLCGASLWIAAIGLFVGGQVLVWIVWPHFNLETVMFFPVLHLSTFLLAKWQDLQREHDQVKPWHANSVFVLSTTALILVNPLSR